MSLKSKTKYKSKKQVGAGWFSNMFSSSKDVWEKSKQSMSNATKSITDSGKNLFSKPTTPPTTTTTTNPSTTSMTTNPSTNPSTTTSEPSYSNPVLPATSGGSRKRKRKNISTKSKSKSKRTKSKRTNKRGGYNLNEAAPVQNLKVALPTYWITGGKKTKKRKMKK